MKKLAFKHLILLSLIVAFLMSETSCTRRDLEDEPNTGLVTIHFDWKNLWSGETIPSGMELRFYGSDGSIVVKNSDGSGFSGYLPFGSYQVAICNSDASNTVYRNQDHYLTTGVYTTNVINNGTTFLAQPLHSYGIGINSLTVSEQNADTTVVPAAIAKKTDIKIIITGEKSAVTACSSSLSGIAQGVIISSGASDQTGGTGTISFNPTVTSDGFESMLNLFGKTVSETNILRLTLQYTGGGSQIIDIDVSPAMKDINTLTNEVTIYVNLEVTNSASSGITTTLKYWSSENRQATVE